MNPTPDTTQQPATKPTLPPDAQSTAKPGRNPAPPKAISINEEAYSILFEKAVKVADQIAKLGIPEEVRSQAAKEVAKKKGSKIVRQGVAYIRTQAKAETIKLADILTEIGEICGIKLMLGKPQAQKDKTKNTTPQ